MALFFIVAIVFLVLWILEKKKTKKLKAEADGLHTKYDCVQNAEQEAAQILNSAKFESSDILDNAKQDACDILDSAKRDAERIISRAKAKEDASEKNIQIAKETADKIIFQADSQAREIAGSALDAKGKADEYEKTALAMKRIIEGYGDEWLKPTYSLLDELAAEYSFTDAGVKLKEARAVSARMVKDGIAANCDYAESYRRETAIQFVIDAFNGKVDSILSKTKSDNYGILEQKIKDAFQLVNKNGAAFRNAHILPAYLDARLDELKWATITQELKKKAAEEQKALRERMREEEKARREYERAQKEAVKEEAMLQKAMEKAKAMLASANEAQKEKYEAELADLEAKLKAAEEKNQRALSMAQQTKHGTVYVISNIGSFGENVYKVGMTRRLEPMDRVKELGDASVPFPFDVHAFIESDDAPALETALHHDLAMVQVNKVNPRKEYFRIDIATIKTLVEKHGLHANWTMVADAAEYRESMSINEQIQKDPVERERWEKFMALSTSEEEDE